MSEEEEKGEDGAREEVAPVVDSQNRARISASFLHSTEFHLMECFSSSSRKGGTVQAPLNSYFNGSCDVELQNDSFIEQQMWKSNGLNTFRT